MRDSSEKSKKPGIGSGLPEIMEELEMQGFKTKKACQRQAL